MRRSAAAVIVLAGLAGFSGGSVPVSGTVTTAAGKPVTGVFLVLMPVEGPKSNIRAFPLGADGEFHGEAQPGTYVYYISRMSVETDEDGKPVNRADAPKQKRHEQAFRKVPVSYRTPEGAGPNRKVEVSS